MAPNRNTQGWPIPSAILKAISMRGVSTMKPTPLRPGTLLYLLLILSAPLCGQQGPPSAPDSQPEKDLVFKSVVNRVILDVVVSDAKGKPVHGLTQQDFSLAEDSQYQQILSFDVHDLDSAEDFPKL